MNELISICRDFLLVNPFYGIFLSTLNKTVDNTIPTAGVGKTGINLYLKVNMDFLRSLSKEVQKGVIHHELLHICLFHLSIRSKYSDKEIFNIAAD